MPCVTGRLISYNTRGMTMERLDEISNLLAASVSRRERLRCIGAILARAVLGPLAGTAWAAKPDRCVAFYRSCPTKKKRNQCQDACRACGGTTSLWKSLIRGGAS